MQVLSIINQKGGVGKTTTTINLAAALAARGKRVLVVDLDGQANATTMLLPQRAASALSIFDVLNDTRPEGTAPLHDVLEDTPLEGVRLAPGDRAVSGLEWVLRETPGRELLLKEALDQVRDDFDFALVDNTPALGLAPAMSLVAADVVIVPVPCQPLDVTGLQLIEATIAKVKARLNPRLKRRVLLTRLDNRTAHPQMIARQLRDQFGDDVFEAAIMESATLQRGALNRVSGGAVVIYDPNSPAASWFKNLASEVLVEVPGTHG